MRRLLFCVLAASVVAGCSSDEPKVETPASVTAELTTPVITLVTHGNDSLPPRPPTLAPELLPETAWPCVGTGDDGSRVQMLYVHGAGAGGLNALRPTLESYARHVEATFSLSAAETGGSRLLRFVTGAGCALSIPDVTVSSSALADFNVFINELAAQGYNRLDRVYHSWVESSSYCGIGTVGGGDGTDPANHRGYQFSRSDSGKNCWDYAEAHEIAHNLGAVQLSAPHSSGGYHCNDDHDLMCYADGGSSSHLSVVCADGAGESKLDCNHDDFYSTAPAPGSYLASHWNVADSVFLESGTPPTTTPPPPPPTTVPPSTTTSTVGTGPTSVSLSVPGSAATGKPFAVAATVSGTCAPAGTVSWFVSDRFVMSTTLAAGKASVTLTLSPAGRYTVKAQYDGSPACGRSSKSDRIKIR